MKKGIFIPARVVRTAVGAVTATLALAVLAELPGIRRYLRLKAM